ncbi:MAG: pirin [Steroidobacteraceae bacterium]|jgi:redox-sensitive bicupin YhaK (pirin superfamily)|nr:pirin [Steroidobacteraceae bacterium]
MNTESQVVSRSVTQTLRGMPASDGAGVKLTRVIGQPRLPDLDPFLMLDEFGTDKAEDYIAGFPDHPHRGFETVTYMLDGRMRHKDNHGNEGVLVPGAVQWMTAGRGIVHSEMPEQTEGKMRGFQLWLNLPARDKMAEPNYQEFGPDKLPVVERAGVNVKVIAGQVDGTVGPVRQPATDPTYLDLRIDAGAAFTLPLPVGHSAFIYVYEGSAAVGTGRDAAVIEAQELAVLGDGSEVRLEGRAARTRAILVAGRPLREPVARYGPFVMNTREEIMQAFSDYQTGKF